MVAGDGSFLLPVPVLITIRNSRTHIAAADQFQQNRSVHG